jgi:hypothetical protein
MERLSFGFSAVRTIVACKGKAGDYGTAFLFQYFLKEYQNK